MPCYVDTCKYMINVHSYDHAGVSYLKPLVDKAAYIMQGNNLQLTQN